MDFTREPIIETIVTPKEGCKLVIRSSKGAGQEEFFVDALEVVSFGNTFFFRSLERPKAFLVPASDYEILEVRETKMVLKNVGLDRSIKIGSGKDKGKMRSSPVSSAPVKEQSKVVVEEVESKSVQEQQVGELKKRDKRRHSRRRRGKDRPSDEGVEGEKVDLLEPREVEVREPRGSSRASVNPSMILSTLLPPPPTLISETIERYKGNALFKDVFYKDLSDDEGGEGDYIPIQEPLLNEEEENIVSPFDEQAEEEDPFNVREEAFEEPEREDLEDESQDIFQEESSTEGVSESNSAQESSFS